MVYVLLAFLALVFLGLLIAGRPYVAAWFYRHFGDPDPYPVEAAESPVDEHFNTAPMDDLDTAVDWHRYEYEMKRKQT